MSTCACAGASARPSFGRDRPRMRAEADRLVAIASQREVGKRVEMRFAHLTIRNGSSSCSAAFRGPATTVIYGDATIAHSGGCFGRRLSSCRRWSFRKACHHVKIEAQAVNPACALSPLAQFQPIFAVGCDLTIVSKILNYQSTNYLIIVSAGDRHDVEGVRAAQELPTENRPADRE
jgi:hypothetical protein